MVIKTVLLLLFLFKTEYFSITKIEVHPEKPSEKTKKN